MKRLSLLVGLAVLAVLWARIDAARVLAALAALDARWLALAFALFVPQTVVAAVRWRLLLRDHAAIGLGDAVRQILASNTLNLILPSKMGDLAKGWFAARASAMPLARGVLLATAEKLLDLGALCAILLAAGLAGELGPRGEAAGGGDRALALAGMAWSAALLAGIGLALAVPLPAALAARLPGKAARLAASWTEIRALWLARPARMTAVVALTAGLWLLHVGQIHVFFLAADARPPALAVYARVPVAILVGLLPLTMAGLGTRDAALIYLFAAWADPARLASVGLLTATRYVVPALAGLPFFDLVTQARAATTQARSSP